MAIDSAVSRRDSDLHSARRGHYVGNAPRKTPWQAVARHALRRLLRRPLEVAMEERKRPNLAMVALAALFLALAWIWDAFIWAGRWVLGLVPWLALRARIIRWINKLPIFLVVLIYG